MAKESIVKTMVEPMIEPKKPRKQKISKKATEVILESPTIVDTCDPVIAEFIEEMTITQHVTDITVVKVKKVTIKDLSYYLDSKSGKAYEVLAKGIGPYKGHYDSDLDIVDSSYLDSDSEF